ncbi:MAG: CBS domain-containing protein [Nitrospiraceae bacterium]|nr:MAG: CBS domain-containing protein [Nitrospiraceae bacterium]
MDIITTHLNADFDALAAMVAAGKYYPGARLVFPGSQERNVRDYLASVDMPVEFSRLRDINLEEITRLVLVDVKSPERIGRFAEILGRKGLVIHLYDHHPLSGADIRGQKEVIEQVGSTTTVFTEMIQKGRLDLSPGEATTFMLGIYEETGSLMFPSTTERDMLAAAYLLRKGANLKTVSRFLSRELSPEEIDLLNELVQSAKEHVIHDIRVIMAKAARETYMGDIAFLVHKIRDIKDADAIFILVMMEDRVQVIGRSHTAEVDAAEILRQMGGGGHPQAASAVVRSMSLEETENRLITILKERIHPSKTARDIMTSPVMTIPWNNSIKMAEKKLTLCEVNVLPVLKNGSYYGLISREVVEKALFHGFSRSRVSEFCTTGAPSVTPSTAIDVIESIMIEQNQRFMPVVENRHIVGAITRTDLLRSLYDSILKKNRVPGQERLSEKASVGKNLMPLLRSKFPPEIVSLLELSGSVAKDLGYSAYLVGGSVRDLLRGESNYDIDIVIEGDGIAFARALGKKLDARVTAHKRFCTAVVTTRFLKFDVATSRTEYYESPAALPRIATSSIKKDLYRRDFTINTLAIMLNPGHFGKLIDYFGGQRDIKDRTIRILHNLSFIEDPTRAFRAIRFSERFGFRISKHTLNLIRTAVRINLFDKLSGARMYDELNLLFQETEPVNAIRRLSRLDLLKFIHHRLVLTKTLEQTFESIQETFAWFKLLFFEEELNRSHLFLMALLEELTPMDRGEALQRLFVPPTARKEILDGIEQSNKTLADLKDASEKDIYYALMPLDIPAILYTMAKAPNQEQKKAISLYLTTLRKITPELTGKDLKKMGYTPGPLFKKILASLLDARLERLVKSRVEEIAFVNKNFKMLKKM